MNSKPTPHFDEVCGYRIVRILPSNRGIIASAPGERKVVLKLLESDCLMRGQLHPSIKERLARVRELPQMQVANLHSVEREGADAYLVWEHLEGETFDEYASGNRSPRDIMVAAREIVLMVEALHAQGIVHGAVHGRNIVHGIDVRWRLTHVSPLLFSDPQEDAKAVVKLLKDVLAKRREERSELGDLLSEAEKTNMPLRGLRARLAAIIESREVQSETRDDRDDDDSKTRRRAVYAALATAGVGAVAAVGFWMWARDPAPRIPVPPQEETTARQPESRGSARQVVEINAPG